MSKHWAPKVPKRYKRSAISGDLNRPYLIGMSPIKNQSEKNNA